MSVLIENQSEPATNGVESTFAEVLAEVMRVDRVSVDSHFFDELGADSLMMAHFCARVRKRADLPSVSMKDIYQHPTIRSLTTALADTAPALVEAPVPAPAEVPKRASTRQYVLCGAVQLLCFLAYCYLAALLIAQGYDWMSAGSGVVDVYSRTVVISVAGFVVVGALPIVAKWLLIGRWKPQQIPIWSLAYVRFWIVKTLLRFNPCGLALVGSPLYVLYLRALGAKVGSGVAIFSRRLPVCTDLLTVGAGTVIRRESFFQCYRAQAGRTETGKVTLGRDVVVGERTVLDIDTSMGDAAQLGHASALHSGQAIPAGERWHGSPAQRTEVDYRRVASRPCGTLRRIAFSLGTLLLALLVYLPIVEGGPYLLAPVAPSLGRLLEPGAAGAGVLTPRELLIDALSLSALLFLGGVLLGLPCVLLVTRGLNRFL